MARCAHVRMTCLGDDLHVTNRRMCRVVEGDVVSVRVRVWDPSAPDDKNCPVSLDGLWKLVAHTAIVRAVHTPAGRAARQRRADRLAQAKRIAPLSPSDEKTLQRDTKLLEADGSGADGADGAAELHPDKVMQHERASRPMSFDVCRVRHTLVM